ncbi:RNA polymerase factor sigma-54 [Helicobacter saguini]|uniref:RNA polymerase factor sigma-54 n=1 Tax=Helicobacter saguini TaxID=1548018 RepID=A0A347VTH1_9HELI|nr:RNA polymerase factor sigma-54 [Helicobacter saguini]MWV62101.1 RNA polymerase factor sigma-54 [Helicobacter saguini]MWV67227.1 RNA polymerase factor sigma-54 [Helicobacter saguini]MWV69580.1 RNA polymerase factor sigma-54 [Helicobacter saguini]MWV70870.1 RNA polymerase factor sigma-54 [Helicobacter saguini]TLD94297.1 RNA polymerase factor sigma-54 [Helicobacter saguini]
MATLRQNIATKTKLSSTLKSWLPILQSPINELEETLSKISEDNPCLNIESGFTQSLQEKTSQAKNNTRGLHNPKNSIGDKIELLTIYEKGLMETLEEQIAPPLFPTQRSQDIALEIVYSLDNEGFFNVDMDEFLNALKEKNIESSPEEVEKIRKRFCHLEPSGIGAKDFEESLIFQLDVSDLEGQDYDIALQIIKNLENHVKFKKYKNYEKIMNVIKKFRRIPSLDYQEDSSVVIADIIITQEDNNIELSLNESYYPSMIIEKPTLKNVEQDSYFKTKMKEARDLVDALDMRRATIRKIGLMIIEYQYDFFTGGEIKPMKLKDLADEFGHSPSTISRAIANKFLECNRGIFPIKSFFTTAIDGDTSNASIKDFLNDLIKNENKQKPLSDIKILELIEKKFELKMVRRTITKYRKQLGILGSSQRKRMYEMSM